MKITRKDTILLMVCPFLTPLCPPVGSACLKSYLEGRGYTVKTADTMADIRIRQICYEYFEILRRGIPEFEQGHFFNIGLDVLWNHFMIHLNRTEEEKYIELVGLLVKRNFFVELERTRILQMIDMMAEFYRVFELNLRALYTEVNPRLLGISVYRGTLAPSLFAFKLMKEMFPDVITVMGGPIFSQELYIGTPNFELFMAEAQYVDKIVVGEGEELFYRLLEGQLAEDKKVYTLEDIDVHLLDLNTLDLPDYSDFDQNKYPMLPIYTSRGCTNQCSFCAETVYWRKYRKKTAEKVADEFSALHKRYGKRLFLLTDCLINPLATNLSKELIERDLNFYWDVYLRVDQHVCDPEYTFLWRQGGFYRARLGIESGSEKMLEIIDKKITKPEIKAAISSLAAAGIKTTTYWIAGHPGETEEDFQQTLDLLEELQDDIFEAECDPFRYFYTGQVHADLWSSIGNYILYPEDTKNSLLTQTWAVNTEPTREVIYERACRFRAHCKKLGIPNPYSVSEIYEADKRWKRLHNNAVPALLDVQDDKFDLNESKKIRNIITAEKATVAEVDFDF